MARVSFALPGTGLAFRVKAGRGRNGNLSLENVICPHCNQMLPEDRREGDCPVCGNPLAGYAPVVSPGSLRIGRYKVSGLLLIGILSLPAVFTLTLATLLVRFSLPGDLGVVGAVFIVGSSLLCGVAGGLAVGNRNGGSGPLHLLKLFWWSGLLTAFSLMLCFAGCCVPVVFLQN